jgi:hypothetical protein
VSLAFKSFADRVMMRFIILPLQCRLLSFIAAETVLLCNELIRIVIWFGSLVP